MLPYIARNLQTIIVTLKPICLSKNSFKQHDMSTQCSHSAKTKCTLNSIKKPLKFPDKKKTLGHSTCHDSAGLGNSLLGNGSSAPRLPIDDFKSLNNPQNKENRVKDLS